MKILVITNPAAGGGKTLRLLPRIKQWLSVSPHEFSFITPPSSHEMRLEIMKAADQGIEALVLIGGDGIVHQALPARSACLNLNRVSAPRAPPARPSAAKRRKANSSCSMRFSSFFRD